MSATPSIILPPVGQSPKFPDALVTSPIWGRVDYVKFVQEFRFESSFGMVIVPKGFDSDGASVPWAVRWIINPHGQLRYASGPHDGAYHFGALSDQPDARKLNQKEADQIIMEAMEACGSNAAMRHAVYSSLRMFGFVAWNRARRAREAELRGEAYVPVAPLPFVRKRHKRQ
jgi:hypothetical protein